ncbi:MAG: ABC transporter permease subunit [Myxococcaceae bacterium]
MSPFPSFTASFHWRRAQAVFSKDWTELLKNKALLLSMMVLPLVLVVVPTGMVWAYAHTTDDASLRQMALFYEPNFPAHENAALFLARRALMDWFGLFLLMPVFVPILISSQSVAGEKERRTLEPLLASPVTAVELVVGKSLASLVPAVALCWVAFLLLCVSVNFAGRAFGAGWLLPDSMWVFGVGVIAPLFAFFGNGVAVLVSARVMDARLAQQLSGVVVLPLLALVGAQLTGVLRAGPAYYATQGAVVLVMDVLLLAAAVPLFDRDRLVSRWG